MTTYTVLLWIGIDALHLLETTDKTKAFDFYRNIESLNPSWENLEYMLDIHYSNEEEELTIE
jgi:hypothetical protein